MSIEKLQKGKSEKELEKVSQKTSEEIPEEDLRFFPNISIEVGGEQIKLSKAEKKFMEKVERGTAIVVGTLAAIGAVALALKLQKEGHQFGDTGVEMAAMVGIFGGAGSAMGWGLGHAGGREILKTKYYLQKKWENFKTHREEIK